MRHCPSTAASVCFPSRRAGKIGVFLLFVLVVAMLSGIFVINSYFVAGIRVQQNNATDAAALAAAEVLAQEALLYGDPTIFDLHGCQPANPAQIPSIVANDPKAKLFCLATQAALAFGGENFVAGKKFKLSAQDVFFDHADVPQRRILATMSAVPAGNSSPLTLAQKRRLNAVRVVGKSMCATENPIRFPLWCGPRVQMATCSEAVLDGYVYGFHTDPAGSVPIPLAPLGLNEASWRDQVEQAVDPTFAAPGNGPLPYGDFTTTVGAAPQDPDAFQPNVYAPILLIGADDVAEAITQFNAARPGITPGQYGRYLAANQNQPLALDLQTLRLAAPASPLVDAAHLARLESNLSSLRGTRLVWPLVSGYDDPQAPGRVVVTGFVAARVLAVNRVVYSFSMDKNGKANPKGKFKGLCKDRPHPNLGKSGEHRQDGEHKHDHADNGVPNGNRGKGRTCLEFAALELTLRPTLLATSTSMVFVKDWPNGPQHQFRFPNAYVKRIRLMK